MNQWSEGEVFSFLSQHFREAANDCRDLAKRQRRGSIYNRLRHTLIKIEDMCRIAAYFRQDARWLQVGLCMHEVHQCAGDWLRGMPRPPDDRGRPRPPLPIPEGELHPRFVQLAELLDQQYRVADKMRRQRTGRPGMILPRMLQPTEVRHPTNYPVRDYRRTRSGLLVPTA